MDLLRAAYQRSEFLLRAAERFSRGLGEERVYQELVDLVVPELADLAAVRVLEDGLLHVLAVAPSGTLGFQSRGLPASALTKSFPPDHPAYGVIARGEVVVVDPFVIPSVPSEAYGDYVRELGIKRAAYVPLISHGQTVGILTVGICHDRTFDASNIQLLEALARHGAMAMENARLFEEAARLRRAAEQANVGKDRFLATISHELRTPLNAILGWARVLRVRGDDPATRNKGIEIIERNANAQAQLIEDLLDVSRIAVGKLKLAPTTASLPTLVRSAVDSARPAADARGVRLETTIDTAIDTIVADPDRLQQVIWNLIANAVKFTEAGGTVRVSVRPDGDALRLCVEDDGVGMAPEFVPLAFEQFAQAEQGAHLSGGLGLGLAIVRHLVELHGGTVSAQSDGLGKGSRFCVRLPMRPPAI